MRRDESGERGGIDSPDPLHRLRGAIVSTLQSRIGTPIRRITPLAPLVAVHRLRCRIRPSRYTDAPAFRLLHVDPGRIRRSLLEAAPRVPQWGRVVGGNWESAWQPFDERAVPRGIEQRYREDREWRDTALFDAFREQLDRFGNAWGYTDIDGFPKRCLEIERLHDSIRRNGYRRQERLHGPNGYATTARLDEINVDIGRDGEIYWRAYGQHRLALAKLLDVESVPVVVHRRHAAWQTIRNESTRRDELTRSDAGRIERHPDLHGAADGVTEA